MKRSFITGIAILLPLALTIAIVLFLVNLLTGPFLELVQGVMTYYSILPDGFWIFSSDQIRLWLSKLLILVFLAVFTILLGMLTRWFFVRSLIKMGDYVLHRIPFVNTLYITFQDVFQTIFHSKTSSFKQVVMIPFPYSDSKTIGLITRDRLIVPSGEERVAVFVPTTPNPTSGYLLLMKPEAITYLDLSVENALKYVISCGVVMMPFHKITKEEAAANMLALDDQEEA